MRIASCALAGRTGHEAGRALLAALYREETGHELPPIAVKAGGKPYFPGSDWHFSISHTPRRAFCALSRREIGIDAEELDRNVNLALAEKILSPKEKAQFDAAPDKRRTAADLLGTEGSAGQAHRGGSAGIPKQDGLFPGRSPGHGDGRLPGGRH